MTQYTEDKRDRAVLVGLSAHSLPREECATEASMEELEALLEELQNRSAASGERRGVVTGRLNAMAARITDLKVAAAGAASSVDASDSAWKNFTQEEGYYMTSIHTVLGGGEIILHAGSFHDDTHRTTGDHAGTGGGGLHQHAACTLLADDLVRNGAAGQGDGDHVLLGVLDALADRLGHFSGLAKAETDLALAVADDHQSGELHDAAALDRLGYTVGADDFFDELAGFSFKSCHLSVFLLSQNSRPPSRAPSASSATRP